MSGTRGGTGKPLFLKCSKCKLFRDIKTDIARAGNLVRTGRIRPARIKGALGRSSRVAVQCKCLDCGHVGWYSHKDTIHLPIELSPLEKSDFEPGFLEALESLKRLKKRAERHNDCDGGMRLWSMQVLILIDCAMSLLDRSDQVEARTELVKHFRYQPK